MNLDSTNVIIFGLATFGFFCFWLGWGFARLSFWYYAEKKHINHPFLESLGYTLNLSQQNQSKQGYILNQKP